MLAGDGATAGQPLGHCLMSLGIIAFIVAVGAAGWLLFRLARGEGSDGGARNVTLLKAVIWLGLVAALFVAKIWPLAFMVLFAAAAVMAIEFWRGDRIESAEADARPARAPQRAMSHEEAASVLGLGVDAEAEEIRAAHRKLIAQIHPDKGGTNYLAAKINEARDLLLGRLGAP